MIELTSIRIIYDGDCPFCQAYVKMVRLKEHYKVELIDARGGHAIIAEITSGGYDLDDGMIVEIEGKFYHGDEAMNRMALMTTDSGILRRFTKWIFKSEWRSQNFYPVLRAGRNLTLKILQHKKIDNLGGV